MKTLAKSKAGLVLVAAAAVSLCVPVYAAPGDQRRGGSTVHRQSVQHAPQRHQAPARHHNQNRDRDRDHGSAGLGLVLGIAAIGALILATQADDERAPAYAPAQAYPPAVYRHPGAYGQTPGVPPDMPQTLSPNYWYYCDEQNGYYPYVQHCAGSWRQVRPTR